MALALENAQSKSASALNLANFSVANAAVAGVSAAQKTQSSAADSVDVDAAKEWYQAKNYTKACIKNIQRAVGFTEDSDIDGIVGTKTIKKVASWQESKGLTVDGEFGAASAKKAGITLESNASSQDSSTTDSGSSLDIDTIKDWYSNKKYTKACIKDIQRAVGFTSSNDIDGVVGTKTIKKVASWQSANGLTADGRFGAASAKKAGITLETKSSSDGSKTDGGTQKTPDPEPVTEEPPSGGNDAGGGASSDPIVADSTSTDNGKIKFWYAVESYDEETVIAIQKLVGFSGKDLDADVGPNTIQKIKDWQKANDLPDNGRFDAACAQKAGITLNKISKTEQNYAGDPEDKDGKMIQLFGFVPKKTDTAGQRDKIAPFMTTFSVLCRDGNGKDTARTVKMHRALAPNVKAIFEDIYKNAPRFKIKSLGENGYSYRPVNNGSNSTTLSNHSWGAAIDINPGCDYEYRTDDEKVSCISKNPDCVKSVDNPFYSGGKPLKDDNTNTEYAIRTRNSPVVKAFAAHGFGWGGEYGDYMHFSYFNGH